MFTQMLRQAGIAALVSMFMGVLPLGFGILYAIRPTEQRLALMRPVSLAAIFGAIHGTVLGLLNVFRNIGVQPDAAFDHRAYIGLAESLDDEATGVLQELLDENGGLDRAEETITGSVNALLSREISDRMSEIDRLMPLASSDEKDDLIREKKRLAVEIKALGRPPWKSFNSARS